jgi:hypothetical protein
MSLQLTNALDSISHCTNRREPPRRSRELTTMFGHRSPIPPDPAMLARVSDDVTEVSFGTYPEAALAVLGVNPAHGPPRKPSSEAASPFDQLDGPARDAAMQAALNQLIAAGTVQFPTDASLQQAVEDGLHGRLRLSEPLATLHELAYWCHRRRLRFLMGISGGVGHWAPEREELTDLRLLLQDTCFGLPGHMEHLLVERTDHQADTSTYTLRTVRREFLQLQEFLFSDITTPEVSAMVKVELVFFSKPRLAISQIGLSEQFMVVREHGQDNGIAMFEVTGTSATGVRTKKKPKLIPVGSLTLADTLTRNFTAVAAKIR